MGEPFDARDVAVKIVDRLFMFCVRLVGFCHTGHLTLILLPKRDHKALGDPMSSIGPGAQLQLLHNDQMVAFVMHLGYGSQRLYRVHHHQVKLGSKREARLLSKAADWLVRGLHDHEFVLSPYWLQRITFSKAPARQVTLTFPVEAPFRYREIEVLKRLSQKPRILADTINHSWDDSWTTCMSLDRLAGRGFIKLVENKDRPVNQPLARMKRYCLTTEGFLALNQLQDRDEAARKAHGHPPVAP